MAENRYSSDAPACFKAYDIRGHVPNDINEPFAERLGLACGDAFGAKTAVIGHDIRLSSTALARSLAKGMAAKGILVYSLGLCGTEEIYHAAANGDFDLGVMITGSHNPGEENGFKLIRRGAHPISETSGLSLLEKIMKKGSGIASPATVEATSICMRKDYLRWLTSYSAASPSGKPLRVVVNAGNGCAGPFITELSGFLPYEFLPVNFEPDGNFPNGVPNPLLPERRADTARAVRDAHADVGVAFDGDFDRCFFYDEDGKFIEGYYLVGLLAAALLKGHKGEKIVHDPRLYWNTQEMVISSGGMPVMGRTGHAFMKEKMRAENALYGGEMSAHHYFRDFAYCDSGMLSMLLILGLVQQSSETLANMVAGRMAAYPCSGEINFKVPDARRIMDEIEKKFASSASKHDRLDGINMELGSWRFSLRSSNTEPLLRLNVESRGDASLMEEKTEEICRMIKHMDGLRD